MSEQQLLEAENEKKKAGKKQKKEKEKEVTELDFSKCDYPLPYSEHRLLEDWFEFNDSSVVPIYPGTLQSKFGGSSQNGSAYMLLYRQKGLSTMKKPELPSYLKKHFETLNNVEEM